MQAGKGKTVMWSVGSESRRTGFTLLELLVVLMIAALMLTLVAPNISQVMPGSELKAFTRHTSALLRELRSEAVSRSAIRTLQLDFEQRRFVTQQLTLDWPDQVLVQLTAGQLPSLMLQNSDSSQLMFFSDGSSNGGLLVIRNEAANRYQIQVDALTGKVSVHD